MLLTNFHTGAAVDPRLYLEEDVLIQDADGVWGSAEDQATVGACTEPMSTDALSVPPATLGLDGIDEGDPNDRHRTNSHH